MHDNRRSHYRVAGEALLGTQADLVVGRRILHTQLLGISAAGAAFRPIGIDVPALKELVEASKFEVVALVIRCERMSEPLVLPSRVVLVHEIKGGALLAVAFRTAVDQLETVERTLLRIFNRRKAVRVDANPKLPIPIQVLGEQGQEVARAVLRDLSLTGMGMTASPEILSILPTGSTHRLAFSLPAHAEISITGTVRSSIISVVEDLDSSHSFEVATVGVEFDPTERDKPRISGPVINWLMTRQLEIRREDVLKR